MKKHLLLLSLLSCLALVGCSTSGGETSTTSEPDHVHQYSERNVAPTCTERGYTIHTCEICGYSYQDNYVNATGHQLDFNGYCNVCGEDGYGEANYQSSDSSFTYELNEGGLSYSLKGIFGEYPLFLKLPSTHNGKPVTKILREAFVANEELHGVEIPDSYVELENVCFDRCINMREIFIPNSVETIGTGAFRYCHGLTIYLESEIEKPGYKGYSIEDYGIGAAADGWNNSCRPVVYGYQSHGRTEEGFLYGIESVSGVESVSITGFIGFDVHITVPSTIEGKPVTKIANHAFEGKERIASIVLPESIVSFGVGSFQGCRGLEQINIPSNITAYPDNCFGSCEKIKSFEIGSNIKKIGYRAFDGTKVHYFYIPDTVDEVSRSSFDDVNKVLYQVSTPKAGYKVDFVDPIFFGIKEVFEKDNVVYAKTKKGWYVAGSFFTNKNLTLIDKFGEAKEKLVGIMPYAFNDPWNEIQGIEKLTIPASVTDIMDMAFFSTSDTLKRIEVEEGNTKYVTDERGVLYTKGYKELVCFMCVHFNEYQMYEGVKTIRPYAFINAEIGTLHFPTSVTLIKEWAFYNSTIGVLEYAGTSSQYNSIETEEYAFEYAGIGRIVYLVE